MSGNWRWMWTLAFVALRLTTAQTPTHTTQITTTSELPNAWVGAGGSYADKAGGWISYAVLVSAKTQIYSFSTYEQNLVRQRPYVVTTSVRTGMCTVARNWGSVYLLGCLDAGTSTNGQSVGSAFSGFGVAMLRIGKTRWTFEVIPKWVRTANGGQQQVYEAGFGRIF